MTKMNSKIEGNTLGILRRSFFPFNALGMPSFNNSVQYDDFSSRLEILKTKSCSKIFDKIFIQKIAYEN